MKRLLNFMLVLFCVLFFGCKKDTNTSSRASNLKSSVLNLKTYNFQADEAITTKDNCFLLIDKVRGHIAKIDANGTLLWEKKDAFQPQEDMRLLSFSASEHFISICRWEITFNTFGVVTGKLNVKLLNSAGVTLYNKPINTIVLDSIQIHNLKGIVNNAGDLITFTSFYGNLPLLHFNKINKQGNLLWEKVDSTTAGAINLFSIEDSSFYLFSAGKISRYDFSGNLILSSTFLSGPDPEQIKCLFPINEYESIISGESYYVQNGNYKYNWFKIELSNSNLLLTEPVFLETSGNLHGGYSCINDRREVVLIGTETINYQNSFKVGTTNGSNVHFPSQSSGIENYNGLACLKNSDGSISIIGSVGDIEYTSSTYSYNPIHSFFLKLSAEGTY